MVALFEIEEIASSAQIQPHGGCVIAWTIGWIPAPAGLTARCTSTHSRSQSLRLSAWVVSTTVVSQTPNPLVWLYNYRKHLWSHRNSVKDELCNHPQIGEFGVRAKGSAEMNGLSRARTYLACGLIIWIFWLEKKKSTLIPGSLILIYIYIVLGHQTVFPGKMLIGMYKLYYRSNWSHMQRACAQEGKLWVGGPGVLYSLQNRTLQMEGALPRPGLQVWKHQQAAANFRESCPEIFPKSWFPLGLRKPASSLWGKDLQRNYMTSFVHVSLKRAQCKVFTQSKRNTFNHSSSLRTGGFPSTRAFQC